MIANAPFQPTLAPLVVHVVFRFDYGGLENGVVNLINWMPAEAFRHAVIALTETTEFRRRLQKEGVDVHALGKRSGKDLGAYVRLYRLLRKLRPTILHTRNIGTLDCALVGWLAGVPVRIHGEHGWDTHDPDGALRKYRWLRKLISPFLQRSIAVSKDLQQWLIETVGLPAAKVTHISNGVDTERFCPAAHPRRALPLSERFPGGGIIVGSVLRFMEIKDPMNLVGAFILAAPCAVEEGIVLRLVMVGDGPLRQGAIDALRQAGLGDSAWLPGARDDVSTLMNSFDLFVLGSRREGISNTLLEAMASCLPLVATNTGGNAELIRHGHCGVLVPVEDRMALAAAILSYARDAELRHRHGQAARDTAIAKYSLDVMVRRYQQVYADAAFHVRS